MNYDSLFTPFKIGNCEIKNRIVMSAMGTLMSNRDGTFSEDEIAYFEARAKGGTGMIIIGQTVGVVATANVISMVLGGYVTDKIGSRLTILILCIAFICMMTGGSTTGTQIALPVITPTLTKLGLSLPFIHRVGTFAATMLDSLPNSGAVIMAIDLADLKMKDGYPPVFVSTVIATTCGTITVALIMTLFPMLP